MRKIIVLLIIILFTGCDQDKYIDFTDQFEFPSMFKSPCFMESISSENDEWIFVDSLTFNSYVDSIRNEPMNYNCDTITLPNINFNTHFLLGKYTETSGCEASFKRKILVNEKKESLIYEIIIKSSGLCDMLIFSNNWVLIPKTYESYTIEYDIKER